MRGKQSGSLQFDPEIEKTAKANHKAAREARQAARLAILEQPPQEEDTSSPYISEDEPIETAEQDPTPPPPPRRTLGDYGLRNNGEI
ncbi:hypothetical protein A2U01_0036313, partial [Trifolium medium]|nr:hypothetical protein [Trifolium medium]